MKLIKLILFFLIFSTARAGSEEVVIKNIDYIKIIKSERKLYAYSKGKLLKIYKIALGRNPVGGKMREGDNKTPEGSYKIISKNPRSKYHLSLKISYPSVLDIKNAEDLKVNAGGDIMIHGIRNGFGFIGKYHSKLDWTQGCAAVSNEEIEEIYEAVDVGAEVNILP